MKKIIDYIKDWFQDTSNICMNEWKQIFTDSGVMIIFFLAGFLYPVLYNIVYHNGTLDNMPIAVVDDAHCSESRDYIRKMDATREVNVDYECLNMDEARKLMQKGKVHGIVYFPKDYGEKLARMEQAYISTYADMSSFLYYKCLMMASNLVMLKEIGNIQIERYGASGMDGAQISQLVNVMPYEDNMPYNRTMSYSIFFLPVAMLLVLQQTLFYGSTMLIGTMREENRSIAALPIHLQGRGIWRVIFGRGLAYFCIYIVLAMYAACLVPHLFHMPQNAQFADTLILLIFFIISCIFFSFTWSTFFRRRETVLVLLLFLSPIFFLLTGVSWPTSSFPLVWKLFSYLIPSTFAAQAMINLNCAGGSLSAIEPQIFGLTVQIVCYSVLSFIALYVENRILNKRRQE